MERIIRHTMLRGKVGLLDIGIQSGGSAAAEPELEIVAQRIIDAHELLVNPSSR